MKVCKKPFIWYLVAILVFSLGFVWYSRWSHIQSATAVSIVRAEIPWGPVRWMAHDGDYIVGAGPAENDYDETALYLYDTKGTWADLSDDTYTIIDQVEGEIERITFYGDYITWLDTTDWYSCSPMTLKFYDLVSESTSVISNQIADFIYSRNNNTVAYQFDGENGRDIAIYQLDTEQNTIICNAQSTQRNPHIRNNIVVWEDLRDSPSSRDIYMYNITSQTETKIAEYATNLPYTNGTYIIYENAGGVQKYHIPTASTSLVSSNDSTMSYAYPPEMNVNENYIVLLGSTLRLYNLSTSQTIVVSNDYNQTLLSINNSQLVYAKAADYDNKKLYGFDIASLQGYPIRAVGSTWSIQLHPSNNTLLMCSKGTGMDPDEWDISYASLP
jgi:beta propeller repeat protein